MSVQYISFSVLFLMSIPNSNSSNTSNNNSDLSDSDDETVLTRNLVSGDGFISNLNQTVDASGNVLTTATFETTAVDSDIQVTQDLSGNVFASTTSTATNAILNEIKDYASKIQCTDFQGKGTIDDYSLLFSAASKIANETKHMELDVDVEGFNDFATAADDLSALFNSFIVKLQNVNIIDDSVFLLAILNALRKVYNLSETFGKFKQTIVATSQIQIPASTHQTKLAIESVVGQLNCAMKYINHFVDASYSAPEAANLSTTEQSIISNAVATIDNWNTLCDQGVSIAMASNPDILYIQTANATLKQNSSILLTATQTLKTKLAQFQF